MAQLPQMFDATQVDPAAVSQMLPVSPAEGWPVVISSSEFKPTKDDPNQGFVDLTLTVIDGEIKGSEGHYRLNLFNKNEKAVEIAYKQLSALCHVTGQFKIADTAQLHNIPFRAVVGLQKKAKIEDPDYTEIKGVKDINGNDPGKQGANVGAAPVAPVAPQAPPQQPVAAQTAAPAPWGAPAAAAQSEAPAAPWGVQAQQPQATAAAAPPWATKPA